MQLWKIDGNGRIARDIADMILSRSDGKLTSSKWAKMCKCSKDTALRDIQALIALKILRKSDEGGRSVNYEICCTT